MIHRRMRLPLMSTPRTHADELAAPSDGIDCVLIGPHIGDMHDLLERARPTEGISAHYDDVKINTVLIEGRRLSYMELFNKSLGMATGREAHLSPFRQASAAICTLAS